MRDLIASSGIMLIIDSLYIYRTVEFLGQFARKEV